MIVSCVPDSSADLRYSRSSRLLRGICKKPTKAYLSIYSTTFVGSFTILKQGASNISWGCLLSRFHRLFSSAERLQSRVPVAEFDYATLPPFAHRILSLEWIPVNVRNVLRSIFLDLDLIISFFPHSHISLRLLPDESAEEGHDPFVVWWPRKRGLFG